MRKTVMRGAVFGVLVLLVLQPQATHAQDPPNRAALVVVTGDGDPVARCVGFDEPEISGYELLQRAQLNVVAEVIGMGATVCAIDGTGCPADNCFCQCPGGPDCVYWSYWHLRDGSWQYGTAGAASTRVGDGAVEGWVWGPGTVDTAVAPSQVAFVDVCGPDAVVFTAVTPAPAAPATSTSGAAGWLTYALFGLIVIGLTIAAALSRRR